MDETREMDIFQIRDLRSNRSQFSNCKSKSDRKEEILLRKSFPIDDPNEYNRIVSTLQFLPEDDCGKRWNDGVAYSIKKKGRWNLMDEFRGNMECWNRINENYSSFVVCALEKHGGWPQWSKRNKSTIAYHGMDLDENTGELETVHRYPKRTYADGDTLMEKGRNGEEKIKRKGKWRNDRRPLGDEENVEEEKKTRVVRLRYDIEIVRNHGKLKRDYRRTSISEGKSHKYSCHRDGRKFGDLCKFYGSLDEDDFDHDEKSTIGGNEDASDGPNWDNSVKLADLIVQRPSKSASKSHGRRQKPKCKKDDGSIKFQILEDDTAGPSGLVAPARIPVPQPTLFYRNLLEMVPLEIHCRMESIRDDHLRRVFGESYYECMCFPRRFVIDVTDRVKAALRSLYGTQVDYLNLRVICVCEQASFDQDEIESTAALAPLKVWINGSFSPYVRKLSINTINPRLRVTIDQVVDGVVIRAANVPLDDYDEDRDHSWTACVIKRRPPVLSLLNIPQPMHLNRYDRHITILERVKIVRKIQRQISCVQAETASDGYCGICMDWPMDGSILRLAQCQHWFCSKCWRSYCVERIMNGLVPITCPDSDCSNHVDYFTMTTFVPFKICELYLGQLRDQYITRDKSKWMWCPKSKCGVLINLPHESSVSCSFCSCGVVFCTKCSADAHWPASCQEAQQYYTRLKERHDEPAFLNANEAEKIRKVQVKYCPHCENPIEKGEGCNHMTCPCGQSFMWNEESFVSVGLLDINVGARKESELMYERSLAHRLAVGYRRRRQLQKRSPFVFCSHSSYGNSTALLGRFYELSDQAHYLLEFIYVHMQFCHPRTCLYVKHLRFYVDRLEFTLGRMKEAADGNDWSRLDKAVYHVNSVLMKLVEKLGITKCSSEGNK